MLKLTLRLLLLLCLSVLPLWWVGLHDRQPTENANVVKLQLPPRIQQANVLLLGNSHTYSGLDRSTLDSAGIPFFCMATAAAGPAANYLVLRDYLAHAPQKPQWVWLNVGPEYFCDESDRFDLYPVHRYLNTPVSNEELLWLRLVPPGRYMELFSRSARRALFHTENPSAEAVESMQEKMLTTRGLSETHEVFGDSILKANEPLYLRRKHATFDYSKEKQIKMLVELCREHHIRLLLHEIPANLGTTYFSEEMMQDYGAWKKRIAAEVLLISGDTLKMPAGAYADIDHLNSTGAVLYTRWLVEKWKKGGER